VVPASSTRGWIWIPCRKIRLAPDVSDPRHECRGTSRFLIGAEKYLIVLGPSGPPRPHQGGGRGDAATPADIASPPILHVRWFNNSLQQITGVARPYCVILGVVQRVSIPPQQDTPPTNWSSDDESEPQSDLGRNGYCSSDVSCLGPDARGQNDRHRSPPR
jgi:hypothetical protein